MSLSPLLVRFCGSSIRYIYINCCLMCSMQFWCGSNKLENVGLGSLAGELWCWLIWLFLDANWKWSKREVTFCVIVSSKWAGDAWRCHGDLAGFQVCSVELNHINEGPKYLRIPSPIEQSSPEFAGVKMLIAS